jgi:hypothetical protein
MIEEVKAKGANLELTLAKMQFGELRVKAGKDPAFDAIARFTAQILVAVEKFSDPVFALDYLRGAQKLMQNLLEACAPAQKQALAVDLALLSTVLSMPPPHAEAPRVVDELPRVPVEPPTPAPKATPTKAAPGMHKLLAKLTDDQNMLRMLDVANAVSKDGKFTRGRLAAGLVPFGVSPLALSAGALKLVPFGVSPLALSAGALKRLIEMGLVAEAQGRGYHVTGAGQEVLKEMKARNLPFPQPLPGTRADHVVEILRRADIQRERFLKFCTQFDVNGAKPKSAVVVEVKDKELRDYIWNPFAALGVTIVEEGVCRPNVELCREVWQKLNEKAEKTEEGGASPTLRQQLEAKPEVQKVLQAFDEVARDLSNQKAFSPVDLAFGLQISTGLEAEPPQPSNEFSQLIETIKQMGECGLLQVVDFKAEAHDTTYRLP